MNNPAKTITVCCPAASEPLIHPRIYFIVQENTQAHCSYCKKLFTYTTSHDTSSSHTPTDNI